MSSRGLRGYLEALDLFLGLVTIPFEDSIVVPLVLLCFLDVDDLISKCLVSITGGTRFS